MKEYCVDLEIAKELEKNRFPQESNFYYSRNNGQEDIKGNPIYDFSSIDGGKGRFDRIIDPRLRYEYYPAPTSDEILKELPHEINEFWLRIEPVKDKYIVGYWEEGHEDERRFDYFEEKKLSNALAKMWLYLKKEGYIIENNTNQAEENWENEGGK